GVLRRRLEHLLRRRLGGEHPRALERRDTRAAERRSVGEEVDRQVVTVGPHTELRVVGEARVAVVEGVAVVRAGRVARRGDRDTHEVRQRRDTELAYHPAIGDAVVDDRWVAIVVRLASAAEAGPNRVVRNGTKQHGPALVEDGEIAVHDLYVVVGSHRAVGVRRCGVHAEGPGRPAETVADAVERAKQRGCGGG